MKTKHLFIPFIVSLFATLICRVCQILNPVNTQVFEIICFFVALTALVISSIITRTTTNITSHLQIKKNLLVTVFSMISSLLIITDSFVRLINYITLYRDIMQLFTGIFGILSGITFALIGISFYKGENCFKDKKIVTLFPCVWGILRLLELFFIYSTVSNKPWEITDDVSIILLVAFFLNLARAFAEIENNKKIKKLLLWGFNFSAFAFIYSSSKLLAYIKIYNNFEFDSFITYLMDLILGIFVIIFLININTDKTETELNPIVKTEPNEVSETQSEQSETIENEVTQNEMDSDVNNQNDLEDNPEEKSEEKNLSKPNFSQDNADSLENQNNVSNNQVEDTRKEEEEKKEENENND